MFKDFKELLSAFHAHGVEYLVIGGYAVGFHAEPRATKDLDVWVNPTIENARAVFKALAVFGAPLEGTKPEDFADTSIFFQMGYPPYRVDILPYIPGSPFEEAWAHRVETTIEHHGYQSYYIGLDDLILSKKATGRLQDLADVEALSQTRSSDEDSL